MPTDSAPASVSALSQALAVPAQRGPRASTGLVDNPVQVRQQQAVARVCPAAAAIGANRIVGPVQIESAGAVGLVFESELLEALPQGLGAGLVEADADNLG